MTTLSFTGRDALNIAIAAGSMPEVLNVQASLWRPARSFPEARRLISTEPQLVRLVIDGRVLLEHLSKTGIPAGNDLLPIAQTLSNVPDAVKAAVVSALGGV
jgi:hypothetical protein